MTMREHHFKKLAASIGRPDLRVHDLRHSFATLGLEQGIDVKTISETLGHASVSFTLSIYVHVSENMHQSAAEKMESLWKQWA